MFPPKFSVPGSDGIFLIRRIKIPYEKIPTLTGAPWDWNIYQLIYHTFMVNVPGDSIRALFIPDRWRSPTSFEFGSLNHHHPKKVTLAELPLGDQFRSRMEEAGIYTFDLGPAQTLEYFATVTRFRPEY